MSWPYWLLGLFGAVSLGIYLIRKTKRAYCENDASWIDHGKFSRDYGNLSELLVGIVEEHGIDSAEAQTLIRRLIAAQMKYAETHGVESEKTIGILISLLPPKSR